MLLAIACQYLGWPSHEQVLRPSAAGPEHYAERVEQKIGKALQRMISSGVEVTTGVLSADPFSDTSEAPIAIVCQFSHTASDEVLREAQRLCWNFSRTALLVTLEPNCIQAWSCAKAPKLNRKLKDYRVIPPIEWGDGERPESILQQEAAQALHWVQLVSGGLLEQHKDKFPKEERVDALLVSNLKAVRARLTRELDLSVEHCHSLLARLIFTQFLFQRTDSAGRPAISQSVLDGQFDGQLSKVYQHKTALEEILRDKEETYALFHWLNEKFNGDMFPGKGGTPKEREAEWQAEKDAVREEHLSALADFVGGKMEIKAKQKLFWAAYSFDTLPLEFISSVYEEFLTADDLARGAHYTPPHLVDFVLDGVLPWGGTNWDLKILDPCCGSAIFLVKAFQRLVQRWKNAHPEDPEPRVDDLRPILENNLLGVDMSREALRVASFSLCLALCDALDPKHYWKRTVFPPLRGIRLIESDFFKDDKPGFQTAEDAQTWDLVIGNAPWGAGSLEADSEGIRWGQANGWPVANNSPGLIFLAKAAMLAKKEGRVAMIVPAMPLLYQSSTEQTRDFRRKFFTSFTIEELISFTHLRWQLFPSAKARACLVTFQPLPPSSLDTELTYTCPKPQYTADDETLIVIEPQDIHAISHDEAAHDSLIWSILLSGGRRDLTLIRRLSGEMTLRNLKAESPEKAAAKQSILTRRGIARSSVNFREDSEILNRPLLEALSFPQDEAYLNSDELPLNKNARVERDSANNYAAFALPQLLVKLTLVKKWGRFQAQLVRSSKNQAVICSRNFITIHQFKGGDGWLRSACLTFRSRVAAYFLILTSRLAADRPEALGSDILDVPIPSPTQEMLEGMANLAQVDSLVEEAFGLQTAESALMEDMLKFVYEIGDKKRPGRQPTERARDGQPGDLHAYADFLVKALRSTFGKDKTVRATVFEEEQPHDKLPLRMVAIHLDWPSQRKVITQELVSSKDMRKKLKEAFAKLLSVRSRQGDAVSSGIGFQRIARVFITHKPESGEKVPTVLYLKPDQRRHWTRSQALRDADELAATILASGTRSHSKA